MLAFRNTIAVFFIIAWPLSASQTIHFVAEELPTFHYYDANHEAKGALVEVINSLIRHTPFQANIELMPFARAYHLAQHQPNTYLFSVLRTPNRENQFSWIGQTYKSTAFLVGMKTNKIQLTSLEQAKKYTLGTIRGYYSETFLKNNGFEEDKNLVLSVNFDSMWHQLFKHRIDYVLTNNIALERELKSANLSPYEIEQKLALVDFPHDLFIATDLNSDPNINSQLASALETIKTNGEYQVILSKWQLQP